MIDYENAAFVKLGQVDVSDVAGQVIPLLVEELWYSSLGKVTFEFRGTTDVAHLNQLVAHHVL